ncbi:hypothetical protein IPA_01570 [Ignicoccus pacificus DSM 13166]|uniref:HAD family hydrolase n=1 Tax=Ignicoccus pacificus DSM 13166 TaxID=940294 RepID=A0A977KAJ2_9CREN|nr:hypothetical protein IPA_01570 [Ignicoccus pacificus DSM 13166]
MRPRFIAFDVDGVLVTFKSSWEMVHRAFGSKGSVEDMKAYFKGEISYGEWCRRDKERWTKALGREPTLEDIEKVFEDIEKYLSPGAREAVSLSKRRGLGVGLVSAGLAPSTKRVAEALGIHLWIANPICEDCEPAVEPKNKLKGLIRLLRRLDVDVKESIFVGDSLIDLPALLASGCGIGVRDEQLKKYVDYWIEDLRFFPQALLYCLHNFRPAEPYPYDEEYQYGKCEGDHFPWVRFLDLD